MLTTPLVTSKIRTHIKKLTPSRNSSCATILFLPTSTRTTLTMVRERAKMKTELQEISLLLICHKIPKASLSTDRLTRLYTRIATLTWKSISWLVYAQPTTQILIKASLKSSLCAQTWSAKSLPSSPFGTCVPRTTHTSAHAFSSCQIQWNVR